MGGRLSFPRPDLDGRVAVVTGGNAGIGYETAKALAVMGAHTIIACRSRERATAAVEQMKTEISAKFPDKSVKIEWMLLDLASFRSTKDFTMAFREKNLPLHILVNNAGIAWRTLVRTEDGYESHFQVNHLSHFLLTLELLPLMLDTAHSSRDGRIVFLSSVTHSSGEFIPENMNAEHSHSRFKFYCHSKLYNVMTAFALQRRLQDSGITVSSVNPGLVDTEIAITGFSNSVLVKAGQFVIKPFLRNPAKGAATSINCAVNPELNTQQCFYYDSCQIKEPSVISRDQQLQQQLWEISVNIVKDYLTQVVLEKYGCPESSQERDAMNVEKPSSGGQPVEGQPSKLTEADENASNEEEEQHHLAT